MSSEPATTAKVILHTTKGQINIELWAKETPIASRHFIQNCLNNSYKDCIFDKIIPNFIIQCSAPHTQTPPFKNEINQRLRFNRRGLVGCCNVPNVRDSNNGQFFITTSGETSGLNGTTTLFGKVVDNTVFNVLKIAESELKESSETPIYETRITQCEVVIQYFDDLVAAEMTETPVERVVKKRKKAKVKLSYDEDEFDAVKVKIKSAHDVLSDKKLSTESAVAPVLRDKEDTDEKTTAKKIEIGKKEDETEEAKDSIVDSMKSKYKNQRKDKETRDKENLMMLNSFIKSEHKWL